jgi:hypothetical protein
MLSCLKAEIQRGRSSISKAAGEKKKGSRFQLFRHIKIYHNHKWTLFDIGLQ